MFFKWNKLLCWYFSQRGIQSKLLECQIIFRDWLCVINLAWHWLMIFLPHYLENHKMNLKVDLLWGNGNFSRNFSNPVEKSNPIALIISEGRGVSTVLLGILSTFSSYVLPDIKYGLKHSDWKSDHLTFDLHSSGLAFMRNLY